MDSNLPSFFNWADAKSIRHIYLACESSVWIDDFTDLGTFINEADSRGICVELLLGFPEIIEESHEIGF